MSLRIASFSIERFRSLHELSVERLGRVNLFTGRNNTGKSSVLEALRLLVSEASPLVLSSILRYREEDLGESDEPQRSSGNIAQLGILFHGFPQISDVAHPIVIKATGAGRPTRVAISVGYFSEERSEDGGRKLIPRQSDLFSPGELTPALVIEADAARRIIPFESLRRSYYRRFPPSFTEEVNTPCMFVSPYGGERTANLAALWDSVALSEREKEVVQALQIIAPDIEAVSMVGGEGARQTRTAILRSSNFSRPVPLRSYGDGLNRLFGIVLSLVNAKDGLLLIDEFENGMHHTVQTDVWRGIFRIATFLNVQVFATSHSWDAVQSFQRAADEHPEEGVLIRLSRKGDKTIPTVFRERELAVAARDHIEVR
jgi:hypothetical protein